MASNKPTSLDLRIGGYMGTSYSVVLEGDVLHHVTYGYGYVQEKESTEQPTDEQWASFLTALDKLRVWRWRKRYEFPEIRDGTSWKVEITWDDRVIESSGSNRFPKNFRAYLEAGGELLGGLPFG